MRVLVATASADFRKGIDGLAKLARDELDHDPFSGCLFVFRNRRSTAVKILVYDGQGFWLCYKRLSAGRFRFWPSGRKLRTLEAHELQVLLSAGDFEAAAAAPPWRRLRAAG
ncbi:MAG: IS66 family insertion sequence element accessory protein TnpB [bacterium]|nr:IS66 family insertion sequence element accessory protein TnpB [bacterium]